MLRPKRDGVVFADPALRERSGVNDAKLRKFACQVAQNFGRAVGGLIVYGNNFDNFRLRGEGTNARGNHFFFVAGGDNCADTSGMVHGVKGGERIDSQGDTLV